MSCGGKECLRKNRAKHIFFGIVVAHVGLVENRQKSRIDCRRIKHEYQGWVSWNTAAKAMSAWPTPTAPLKRCPDTNRDRKLNDNHQVSKKEMPRKQMRPEPATRAAPFVDVQHAFSFARDEGDVRDGLRTLGGVHPCVLCESRTRSHCDGQRLSLPRGRLPEEAATPGQSARAERVLTNPRQIHPREPAGTASAIAMLQAANITRFNVSTLLEEAMRCNRKARRVCAEAVEDRNFLWNAQENEKQIFPM